MEKFIVSARKYRPATFGTLIGQDSIATTLKNSIKRGQLAHAYLFCGPRGVGKTTTARIFAKIINCMNPGEDMEPCGECESCKSFDEGRSYCIHELDAASNNSVDDIRALTEKVMIPPQIGKYSVYIIDEVHMLSTSAFNAFLKTLEEPPAHAIFILATTEKHKIIPTILSRCQVYDFNRISVPDIVKNLRMIASKEDVQIDDSSLHVIAQKADGAMRDALTLFDQVVAFCGNTVDYPSVIKNLNVLDYDYYFKLINNSLEGNFADSLVLFDQVLTKGFNALYFVGGLGNHLRNLLVCKETASSKLLEVSPELEVKYRQQSQRCPLKFLFRALAATEKCETDYARSNNQRLLVEFMLVRMSQLVDQPAQPKAQAQAAEPAPTQAASFAVPRMSEEKPEGPSVAQAAQTAAEKPAEPQQPVAEKPAEPAPAQAASFAVPRMSEQNPKDASVAQAAQTAAEKPAEAVAEQPAEPQQPVAEKPAEPAPAQAASFAVPRISEEKPEGPSVAQAAQTAAEKPAEPQQPVAEQPAEPAPAPAFASGLSINGLINEQKEETKPQKPLDFMGPSMGKPVTQQDVTAAWNKMVQHYEQKNPKLGRFIAALKEAKPVLEQDALTIDFFVSNINQKTWIEQQTGPQMASFLRKTLENESVRLAVKIKSRDDVQKKMYMPQDKDRYLTESNPEFAQLKKDIGAELK
ncbi:MAG: DNA polymerase III subunit gamma/tau [Bacteroidales bacterium]|nr:DNA polymerase III subunit gamma/tau [Bacteroidales bacterium]